MRWGNFLYCLLFGFGVSMCFADCSSLLDDEDGEEVERDDDANDEEKVVQAINELKRVSAGVSLEKFLKMIDEADFDDLLIMRNCIKGFEQSRQIGIERMDMFERYMGAGGEGDLLAFFLDEEGDNDLHGVMKQYLDQGGSVKVFEKMYNDESVEDVIEMMNEFSALVKKKGLNEGEKYLKKIKNAPKSDDREL